MSRRNAGKKWLITRAGGGGSSPPTPTPPVANFTASPLSGTEPLSVTFTDTSTGSPYGFQWDFTNDGSVDSTAQNPTHTYTTNGTYSVKLTVFNVDGTDSEIKTNYITVNAAGGFTPSLNFSDARNSQYLGSLN